MKKKTKNILVKLLIMIIISCVFYSIFIIGVYDVNLYLKNLDYKVTINQDGSMDVVETWDIKINEVNTVFKSFDLDSSKFGSIKNVKVKDLNNNKELMDIEEYLYHVPVGYYYGLVTQNGDFEIAWGTGLENSSGRRKYQISYTVEDVVKQYSDCQELYWQFLAQGKNEIPAKKVTGTVTLAQNLSNIEKLKVWGHGQLNGEIHAVDTNKVEFWMDNLKPKAMLEIRIISDNEKMCETSNRTENQYIDHLYNVIQEETQWADEANNSSNILSGFIVIYVAIYCIIILIMLIKILYRKKLIDKETYKIEKLEYYRDIPREDATPTEAAYLYNFNKERLQTKDVQKEAVSATILDLCLKRKIGLEIGEKEKIKVKILTDKVKDLKKDELEIYKLLSKVAKNDKEFEINELNSYAKKHYDEYSISINKLVNEARNSLYNLNIVDKAEEKKYLRYKGAKWKYSVIENLYEWLIVNHFMGYIPVFNDVINQLFDKEFHILFGGFLLSILPMVLLKLKLCKMESSLENKIAVLTINGSEEKEKWKALKKFMTHYSLLNERKVEELVIWEKYLVYATALGVAEKVVEEMKANYPEVFVKENWNDQEMMEKYPVIHFMYNPYHVDYYTSNSIMPINSLNSNVSKAYHTSITEIAAHASSSGSGRRRWILWRRRRPEAVGGRNGRKIEKRNVKMEIIVGKTSGFCNGVRNAVEKANYVLEESNEPVYCLGELVHNEVVTKELENKGIIFIENIEETKGKTIIRAHGVSKEIYEKAYKNEINLIDLTCPYVLNIHKIVEEYRNKGYYIILVGEKKHPEIIGTYSFCGENSIVISNENEVQSAIEIFEKTNINKLLIIVQTTYSIKGFDKIVKSIESKIKYNVELKVKNTICSATENRQKELEQMSKEVDCMIIVGGKKSSNTNKLYEISCKNCKRTIFVESAEQIDTNIIDKNFKIGIMAGASTPQKSVENIINKLKEEVYV